MTGAADAGTPATLFVPATNVGRTRILGSNKITVALLLGEKDMV